MNAAELLRRAATDGVALRVGDDGVVKVRGPRAAVDRWLPIVREHRPEVIQALTRARAADAAEIAALVDTLYRYGSDEDRVEALSTALADPGAGLLALRLITRCAARTTIIQRRTA